MDGKKIIFFRHCFLFTDCVSFLVDKCENKKGAFPNFFFQRFLLVTKKHVFAEYLHKKNMSNDSLWQTMNNVQLL